MQRGEASNDKAYQAIRDLVIDYVYKPGDRLYETTLADQMAMSRTPIREALTRLVSTGFLERDSNKRGYRVPSLTDEDMKTTFRIRTLLEEHTTGLAAQRATDETVEFLYLLNKQEKKALEQDDRGLYTEMNEKFHLALAEQSGDPYAYRYVQELVSRTTLYNVFFAGFYTKAMTGKNMNVRTPTANVEHRAIIDAMAERKPDLAASLMRNHMLASFMHYAGASLQKL
jgi:DNA-binding GntR family transcriptional regulator